MKQLVMNALSIKRQLFLLRYITMFVIDIALLVVCFGYLFTGSFQRSKVVFAVLIIVLTVLLFSVRKKLIGSGTVLDQFSSDPQLGKGLLALVMSSLSALFVTTGISLFHWSYFLNDFEKLTFTPIAFVSKIVDEYQSVSLHVLVVVVIAYTLFWILKPLLRKSDKDSVSLMVWIGVIGVFLLLFAYQPLAGSWKSILGIPFVGFLASLVVSASFVISSLRFILTSSGKEI